MNTSDAGRQSEFDDGSPLRRDCLEWVDQQQRRWRVELSSDAIALTADEMDLTIPSEMWSRDIYVAPHGQSFIIRFETFDLRVAFVVSADLAAPFLTHIVGSGSVAQEPVQSSEEPRTYRRRLCAKLSAHPGGEVF